MQTQNLSLEGMQTPQEPGLITLAEAARIANVSYTTIWRAAWRGAFPAVRIGRRGAIRVPREPFLRWLYEGPA